MAELQLVELVARVRFPLVAHENKKIRLVRIFLFSPWLLRESNREGVGERKFPVEEGFGKPWVSEGFDSEASL